MKLKRKIIGLSALFGLMVWFLDAIADYYMFYEGEGTFLEILILSPPPQELYIRTVILAWFIVFGVLMSLVVAKQQQAEIRLQRSEENYRLLFDKMISGFALCKIIRDENGRACDYRFLEVNPAFEKLMERRADEVIGKTVQEVLRTTELHALDVFGKVALTGNPVHFENYNQELDKYYDVTAYSPGKDLLAAIFEDITEQRHLAERLHQSEKMEAMGRLAGGIAHDFNNQLAAIMGYGEILKRNLDNNKKFSWYADMIIRASTHSSELIQQLLAFARKGKYLSVPINIHNVIGDVINLFEHIIDKRIKIKQKLEAISTVITGDPTQIENALLNIALNAADAMPNGGELTFTTKVVTLDESYCQNHIYEITPGPFIQISVTDTGSGMNETTQKHVFEPFFTTKKNGKGTGMGLAAVHGTIKTHHGTINIYSEVGHGTTFKVYLPLEESPEKIVETEKNIVPAKANEQILVVDDEEMVCDMAAHMLKELKYKVTTCKNGAEALDYYRQSWQYIDLVIIDMVMPDISGHDTFIAMREINPEIKALLSSGYSSDGEAQKILDEGVLSFVQKPFRLSDLSQKVAAALSRNYPS